MRFPQALLLGALLLGCGAPAASTAVDEEDELAGRTRRAGLPPEWPGYYEDTLSCYGCPGVVTQLWVRSDSTFILRERYLGRDSLAKGTIGRWHVVLPGSAGASPLMTIGIGTDKPDFWLYDAPGIVRVDEIGYDFDDGRQESLEKLADEIGDEVPRMRLAGTLTYIADALRFRPCASEEAWPCAGGLDFGADEGEVTASMTGAELQQAYRKAVAAPGAPWRVVVECSMAMGPAEEGDGADEYILVHRIIGPATEEDCPW